MKLRHSASAAMIFMLAMSLGFQAKLTDKQKRELIYLTAEDAGPDVKVQGEYEGHTSGGAKLGIQVIGLGDGKFRAVLHNGGLPGAGWDGKKKLEVEGKTADDKTSFAGAFSATVADGAISGKTDSGETFEGKRVVRESPTAGAKPLEGAIVLYDGSNADAWKNPHVDGRNLLQSGSSTKQNFGDFALHVEFILPYKPFASGQERANSGLYLQDRYEIQVLDSFGLKGLNNECGGIYSRVAPSVNMCLPPLQWQTYDIEFEAARFDASGKKIKNAVTTVKHNGVVVHDKQEIEGSTGGGKKEDATPGAIQLQGHGNPVFYRNVWIVEKK